MQIAMTSQRARNSVDHHLGDDGFDFSDLRVFQHVPDHNHDLVAMRGLALVFDRLVIRHEGLIERKLYVRESQRAPGASVYRDWVIRELADEERLAGPSVPLVTSREVVQAISHRAGGPAFRLASGVVDGPYKEWFYGRDIIGKVVGVYAPDWGART